MNPIHQPYCFYVATDITTETGQRITAYRISRPFSTEAEAMQALDELRELHSDAYVASVTSHAHDTVEAAWSEAFKAAA
jgi:hypothetical protein